MPAGTEDIAMWRKHMDISDFESRSDSKESGFFEMWRCFRNTSIGLFHSWSSFYAPTSVIYDKIYIHISLKEFFQIVPAEIPGDKTDLCHRLKGSILPLHKIMACITINCIVDSVKYNMITYTNTKTVTMTTNRH